MAFAWLLMLLKATQNERLNVWMYVCWRTSSYLHLYVHLESMYIMLPPTNDRWPRTMLMFAKSMLTKIKKKFFCTIFLTENFLQLSGVNFREMTVMVKPWRSMLHVWHDWRQVRAGQRAVSVWCFNYSCALYMLFDCTRLISGAGSDMVWQVGRLLYQSAWYGGTRAIPVRNAGFNTNNSSTLLLCTTFTNLHLN